MFGHSPRKVRSNTVHISCARLTLIIAMKHGKYPITFCRCTAKVFKASRIPLILCSIEIAACSTNEPIKQKLIPLWANGKSQSTQSSFIIYVHVLFSFLVFFIIIVTFIKFICFAIQHLFVYLVSSSLCCINFGWIAITGRCLTYYMS